MRFWKNWKNVAGLGLLVGGVGLIAFALLGMPGRRSPAPTIAQAPSATQAPTSEPTVAPSPTPIVDFGAAAQVDAAKLEQRLRDSIRAGADYLTQNQLSNGELPYIVDVSSGERVETPSLIRLVAGTGALYTACRVTGDDAICWAADRALALYLGSVVEGERFGGLCLYDRGRCAVGGAALAIDAIYKRWQATGSTALGETDLTAMALGMGEHIIWLKRADGGLYHALDPFPGGGVDADYFVVYFNGESLMALLELYEMTGDPLWLEEARSLNAYMLQQEITHDHWHGYAFRLFALLDTLTVADSEYATEIAKAIIRDEEDLLEAQHSSISNATKAEALAGIAVAFLEADMPHEWLAPEIQKFAQFVMDRQLPANGCGWSEEAVARYTGGIYRSCEDPYIRLDANQHWINGAATFLEYLERARGARGSS